MKSDMQAGIFWLILTVFLEARDQAPIGQKNVAKVIMNRARAKNLPVSDIILARKQFSCYNEGLEKAMTAVVREIKEVAKVTINVQEAIDDWLKGDTLAGATHYFNPDLVPGRWPASWDRGKMRIVYRAGDHIFLREV